MTTQNNIQEDDDLFQKIDTLPENIQAILKKYDDQADTDMYKLLSDLQAELEPHGYTFEFGLDAVPYDLKKIK